jgi:hypothetical protein
MITTIKVIVTAAENLLCEAVLATIFQAYLESQKTTPPASSYGIGAADIGKRSGIYRERGVAGLNDAVVHGVLNLLSDEKKVERTAQGQWILTETELNNRIQLANETT